MMKNDLPCLLKNHTVVFHTVLPIPESLKVSLGQNLSMDEWQWLNQLKNEHDKTLRLTTRALLRYLLGHYLNKPPSTLLFSTTPFGKPYLHSNPLYFNVSHSHQALLIAISRVNEVGVDIEYHNPDLDYLAIANTFLTEKEYDYLLTLPLHAQKKQFYNVWTQKEAFLKGIGHGFSQSPETVEIDNATVKSHPNWHVSPLTLGEGYSGALAEKFG